MSTTGVSFKVEAQTPGSASLDGMARAAALLAQREAELTAQMRAAAAASLSVSDAERDAAQAIRTATIAVEMKADALGISVAQLRAMEAATSQAAASEERAAREAAQLAAALAAVSAAEERAATEAAQLAAHAASLSADERQLAASIRETTAAAEMNAKALGLTGSQYSQLAAAKAKAKAEQDRLTASMAAGSKSMDAAGYAAGNLRFQMFDVGQSLAMGMNPMMILAQQGPQVAQAFTQASQSGATMGATIKAALGPLAVALPVVAVAAAGLAMAYQGLTANSEAAADAQAALALGLSHTEELTREATRSTARLQLIMEGASKEAIAAADTFYSTGDAYREATKESDALIASHVKLLELKGVPDSWEAAIGGVSRGMGDLADAIDRVDGGISGLAVNTGLFAFLSSAMDGVSTSTKELEQELQAAVVGQLRMRDATDDVRRAKSAESNATHKQTEASKAHRKAAGEESDAADEAAAALRRYVAALQEAAEVQTALAGANADTLAAGLASFGEMADAARAASLSEVEQIEATAAAKIRTAERTMQRIKAISGLQASALETAEAEHQAAVTAIRKEAADAQAALVLERSEAAASSFQSALESLVPASTLSDMDRLLDIAGKIAQAYADGAINAEQFATLSASVGNTQTGIQAKGTASTAGKVGQALSSPLSAAASLHPIAQAVYAGLQSAANMQDGSSVFTEASDMIQSALGNLGAFVESAFAAAGDIIANAPRMLVEALPEILQAVADGIPMLAQSVADMATGLVEALAEVLPQLIPELVIVLAQVFIGAVPMIALALASAVLDPAFYEAIGEAFVRGIEAAFERIGNVGEDLGQTLGTGTTAGGGFQLFGLPVVPATTSSSSVVIQPGDLWGDFTRAISVEASKLGRT